MSAGSAGLAERHFSCRLVHDLVAFLDRRLPPAEVAAVLAAGGEEVIPESSRRSDAWISHDRFRDLLEAASAALGGVDALQEFGVASVNGRSGAEIIQLIQTMGSPEALLTATPAIVGSLFPALVVETEEVAPREWLAVCRTADGLAPYRELCRMQLGQYEASPPLFGYPDVEVVEEACQCDGAPACRFRVRWQDADAATRAHRLAQLRAELAAAQLEQFQDLVAHLASENDAAEILRRIVGATAQAVAAPQCALILTGGVRDLDGVFTEGLDAQEAERLAAEVLEAPEHPHPDRLVCEVVSGNRRHGYLVVVDPGARMFAQGPGLVGTYARLAAGYLSTTAAIAESKRDERTARSLLELSSTLAEIVTPDEMALKLARAAPDVLGCRGAAVYLVDARGNSPRLAASHGYSDAVVTALRFLPVSSLPREDAQGRTRLAPIGSRDERIGWIIVDYGDGPSDADAATLGERLNGLAAHGATAIMNARLVDQIRHQALHDGLTGLANRVLIMDRIEHMLSRRRRDASMPAVLFLDLDGFKSVNDSLGHDAGDRLLRSVAERLTTTMREADTVGRLGGDEFVVLVDGATMDAGPELVAERILAVLAEPYDLGDGSAPLLITASVGIAVGDRASAAEMLRDADVALYAAKAAGKSRFVVFEHEMQTAVQDQLMLEMDLRGALEAEQFSLLYQPIFNLGTGVVTGVEALLRWLHPVRGVVEPDDFIPALEENGLIVDVGRWVMAAACAEAVGLRAAGHDLSMSVNVSVRQLEADGFADEVRDALTTSGLDPSALVLEITESALMRNADAVVPTLEVLRELGVRVAIDDFGTGYSSLSYLQRFPVDSIKIDRSFVAAMAGSADSRALVHTLVQLGRTLNLETLAEGIEEAGQHTQLQDEECQSGQGYLFARPLEPAALARLLADRAASGVAATGRPA